jgi:hypothetical protein
MEIANGLELLPGDDGTLPARVRWAVAIDTIEAVAVDGSVVYVAAGALTALRLADGAVVWEAKHPEGYALEASGDVVIGLDDAGMVRVFAPWEYDLRVERATGRLVSMGEADGDVPTDLVPFPQPPPTRVRVEPDFEETVAYWPDGRVAWRLLVARPLMEPQIPIEADETILCATASGHLVALEHVNG